jgi:hypothetical protein
MLPDVEEGDLVCLHCNRLATVRVPYEPLKRWVKPKEFAR